LTVFQKRNLDVIIHDLPAQEDARPNLHGKVWSADNA